VNEYFRKNGQEMISVQVFENMIILYNTRKPGAADAISLLYPICNFNFVVAIVIVQMCLDFYERHQHITAREIM
jgi:hypothetical protein